MLREFFAIPRHHLFYLISVSRNMVNILLYVSEHCQRYYPAAEIPAMLETFLPLLTKEVRWSTAPSLPS